MSGLVYRKKAVLGGTFPGQDLMIVNLRIRGEQVDMVKESNNKVIFSTIETGDRLPQDTLRRLRARFTFKRSWGRWTITKLEDTTWITICFPSRTWRDPCAQLPLELSGAL
jgi:hypothetical protein